MFEGILSLILRTCNRPFFVFFLDSRRCHRPFFVNVFKFENVPTIFLASLKLKKKSPTGRLPPQRMELAFLGAKKVPMFSRKNWVPESSISKIARNPHPNHPATKFQIWTAVNMGGCSRTQKVRGGRGGGSESSDEEKSDEWEAA